MKKTWIIILVCLIFALSLGFVAILRFKKNPEPPLSVIADTGETKVTIAKATLELVGNPVWIILPITTEKIVARNDQEIVAGTTVITGVKARAQVVYPNHTVTRMDENTQIVIQSFQTQPTQVKVKLEKNRIWSRVSKLLGKESYQTETSTVVATVRGTSYDHGILSDGRNKIITIKGSVEASCVEKNLGNLVTKYHKLLLNCGKDNEIEEGLINDKDKDAWYEFNEKEDKKLDERFGSETYGDEEVLGVSTDILGESIGVTPSPAPNPAVSYVDCVGPDGKIAHAPQADCDNLKKFWAEHQPQNSGNSTNSTNNSSSTTETISTNNTNPSPSSTPIASPDTQGPLATNFTANPMVLDGQTCTIIVTYNLSDPSGVLSTSINWNSVDPSGTPASSGSQVMDYLGGPLDTNPNLLPIAFTAQVPAFGKVDWEVVALDTLQNQSITPSGITIQEINGKGC